MRRVVSASKDNTLRVWGLGTGEMLQILEGHTDEFNALALTEDEGGWSLVHWTTIYAFGTWKEG